MPSGNITRLRVTARVRVERTGLGVTVKLFNFDRNRFDSLAGALATGSFLDVVAEAPLPISNYMGPSRRVIARVAFGPINDEAPNLDGWLHFVDLTNWLLAQ